MLEAEIHAEEEALAASARPLVRGAEDQRH
ncbi:hypothetical protein HD557_001783 [Nocardioides luteus]|nr:hypothetical protein [Nocardioides luteus]